MKAMNRVNPLAAGLLVVLGAACTARGDIVVGDTISLTFEGVTSGRSVAYEFNGDSGTTNAGILNWAGGLQSFCIQLEENIGGGTTVNFDVVDPSMLPDQPPLPGPMGLARSAVMQDLFSRYYDSAMSGTADDAAAFQVVIWEISHEMDATDTDAASVILGLDLGAGAATFNSSASVNAIANDMLANLGSGGFNPYSRLLGLTNGDYQDQLIVVPSAGAIAGLGCVAAIRRRRHRS